MILPPQCPGDLTERQWKRLTVPGLTQLAQCDWLRQCPLGNRSLLVHKYY